MNHTMDNKVRELQQNKDKYSTAQNDIVIGLGRPMYGASMQNSRKKAYPAVIATMGQMDVYVRKWIAVHNFLMQDYTQSSGMKANFTSIVKGGSNQKGVAIAKKYSLDQNRAEYICSLTNNLLEMFFMGISLGHAYAHPHDGDTVCSVMVGGLRTVLNGAFQVHTGDLLMFYFADEVELFEEDGSRKPRSILQDPNGIENVDYDKIFHWMNKGELKGARKEMDGLVNRAKRQRREYHDMENANFAYGPNGRISGKTNVFYIKPYIVSRHPDEEKSTGGATVPEFFPCDRARIFGRAISNARPHDFVDIQLSRQAY